MNIERYTFARLRVDLARDVDAYLRFAAEYHPVRVTRRRRLSALLMPSMIACVLYRVSHWLHCAQWPRAAMLVARINLLATRASINPASRIGPGLYIAHPSTGVVFQANAGEELRLFAGCSVNAAAFTPLHGGNMPDAPQLGDNVSLGAKACVCGPVRIGSNVRIGFDACVTRDLPDGVRVVAGTLRARIRATVPGGFTPGR